MYYVVQYSVLVPRICCLYSCASAMKIQTHTFIKTCCLVLPFSHWPSGHLWSNRPSTPLSLLIYSAAPRRSDRALFALSALQTWLIFHTTGFPIRVLLRHKPERVIGPVPFHASTLYILSGLSECWPSLSYFSFWPSFSSTPIKSD